jgi:fluoroacetyl-CoA thioesterase
MRATLVPGVSLNRQVVVDAGRTIGFMGDDCRVYATPALIGDIEYTCRDLLMRHADAGEDSVGAVVNITHMAPTLLGMGVEITVEVVEIDGRRVVFKVSARDGLDAICRGTHERFVVDVAKTAERLRAKAARVAAAGAG